MKWLHRIDVLTEPYVGESRPATTSTSGPTAPTSPVTVMREPGTDHRPSAGPPCSPSGTYMIRGKAWSGTGPITSVEVSFTWRLPGNQPNLAAPHRPLPLAGLDLRLANPSTSAATPFAARATDAAGNVQPEVPPWNRLGYGNNAIEVLYVDVR